MEELHPESVMDNSVQSSSAFKALISVVWPATVVSTAVKSVWISEISPSFVVIRVSSAAISSS